MLKVDKCIYNLFMRDLLALTLSKCTTQKKETKMANLKYILHMFIHLPSKGLETFATT